MALVDPNGLRLPPPINLNLGGLGIGSAIGSSLIGQVGSGLFGGGTGGTTAPAPVGPPAPGAPVAIGGHWQNPDWEALIKADPEYIAGIGNINAQETTIGEQRAKAIKQALIAFGIVPAGYTSKYGDVNAADLEAAKANPFSVIATLADQQARQGQDLSARLAARGMLSSGALTGGNQSITTAHDRAVSDATNQLLAALGGYEGNYASGFGALEGQRSGLYGGVGSRVAQQNQPTWITDYGPAPAPPPTPAPAYNPLPALPPGVGNIGSTLIGLLGGSRFNKSGKMGQLGLGF